jgi:hypothetical protein
MLMLSAEAAESAPAPLRRPGSTCEVVFVARMERFARIATDFVRSDQFLDDVLRSGVVDKPLAHVESQAERRAWLRKRLSVSFEGEKVRVRFDGPVSVLWVVAGELTKDRPDAAAMRNEWTRRAVVMNRLRGQGRGNVSDADYFEAVRMRVLYDLLVDPPTVLRAPRRVDR